ncbi:hypothetical protein PHLCEN_2v8926 [Hermanssonia centrifuga]|uniref:Uncharacterized protein n=1 Tax=Hermanssonia centrifuga TaxID=98765 RepID=A0A2R6NRZ7_9APHY|nr:hypothetical protein PHLCEN_2v8926 [Hermanssonia centrifuga]
MVDENASQLAPRELFCKVFQCLSPFGSSKARSETRVLPKRLGVWVMVEIAETPAGLRQRDVGSEIAPEEMYYALEYFSRDSLELNHRS